MNTACFIKPLVTICIYLDFISDVSFKTFSAYFWLERATVLFNPFGPAASMCCITVWKQNKRMFQLLENILLKRFCFLSPLIYSSKKWQLSSFLMPPRPITTWEMPTIITNLFWSAMWHFSRAAAASLSFFPRKTRRSLNSFTRQKAGVLLLENLQPSCSINPSMFLLR